MEHVGSKEEVYISPHYREMGPDKCGFGVSLFLCHGAPLCTSAPVEGLHMYHQPCSMTNYICEMRLWRGLPSQSLLLGYVYRFQHEVLHCVCLCECVKERKMPVSRELTDINPVNIFLSLYRKHCCLWSQILLEVLLPPPCGLSLPNITFLSFILHPQSSAFPLLFLSVI